MYCTVLYGIFRLLELPLLLLCRLLHLKRRPHPFAKSTFLALVWACMVVHAALAASAPWGRPGPGDPRCAQRLQAVRRLWSKSPSCSQTQEVLVKRSRQNICYKYHFLHYINTIDGLVVQRLSRPAAERLTAVRIHRSVL